MEDRHALLKLAIKRKGAAGAEAFAFARYQLYQSVYWHHTFRAVKAMFLDSASGVLEDLKKKFSGASLFYHECILNAYLKHVVGLATVQPFSRPAADPTRGKKLSEEEKMWQEIENRLATKDLPAQGPQFDIDRPLVFLWKLAQGKYRILLEDLIARNYYKRVMEISLGDIAEDQRMWLRDMFMGDERLRFRERVEKCLLKTLRTAIQAQIKTRESLARDEVLERMETIASNKFTFIVDIPLRGWTAGGDSPILVSDFKRRHFRASVGVHEEHQGSKLWSEYIPKMMREVAFFRVFCEPNLHKILTRVLNVEDILEALKDEFPKLKSQKPIS